MATSRSPLSPSYRDVRFDLQVVGGPVDFFVDGTPCRSLSLADEHGSIAYVTVPVLPIASAPSWQWREGC